MIHKTIHPLVLVLVLLAQPHGGRADAIKSLPRSSPEAQGLSSAGILSWIEAADQNIKNMHSLMVVRHGHVVAEGWWAPHGPEVPHVLWSLTKSFTSTAVGFAVTEGKLNVDDPVLKFFPEEAPENPSENLKKMRVRDLLTMTCGHENEAVLLPGDSWVKTFLAHPVPFPPGTHFKYNTPGSYMLSAIVKKATGEDEHAYLSSRLFAPLGIPDPQWIQSPQEISIGGYGLFLRTEDIAKFGQLYLQKGQWEGRQLIPEAWVKEATSRQVPNGNNPQSDWNQGYGYQFWQCRHQAFRGDGKDGQFCIVVPEQDLVVAMTANTNDLGGELNLVWTHLLPALQNTPLAENPDAQEKLKAKLASLSVKKTGK